MIITGITRFIQIVFAAVVLGLSVSLAKQQVFGHVPALTAYSAFVGGFGMLAALVGIAALFVEMLSGPIGMGIDALASLFFLAGGIAVAVNLRHINCSSSDDFNLGRIAMNPQLNGGCIKVKGQIQCGVFTKSGLKSACMKDEADAVFMFFGFLVSAGLIALGFMSMRKGRSSAI